MLSNDRKTVEKLRSELRATDREIRRGGIAASGFFMVMAVVLALRGLTGFAIASAVLAAIFAAVAAIVGFVTRLVLHIDAVIELLMDELR